MNLMEMMVLRRCLGVGADSPRAQQRSPMARRSSTPFRRSSGPRQRSPAALARRASAEARLQQLPTEHQAAALPATPSAPGNIRLSACRPITACCSIGSPAAATPLPPGCGPQTAYQHCDSFFAERLPATDVDCWASPQGGLWLPTHAEARSSDWGTDLRATQSAESSMAEPAQLQLQLPHLLPSYCSAPASMYDTCSQPDSGRRRCSSGQLMCSEDRPRFSVCTHSNPECSSMNTTPEAATGALPARSFSLAVPPGHPAALLQRAGPQRDMLSRSGGWHQVQSVFALVGGASEAAPWSSGGHNSSANPDSEVWGTGQQLAAASHDLQLRPPSTLPQVVGRDMLKYTSARCCCAAVH